MENAAILHQQYDMIRGSRGVVLQFAETNLPGQLHTPVPAFADKSIAYLLVHNANVYLHWMANFTMKLNMAYADEKDYPDLQSIRNLYMQVDQLVISFINTYDNRLAETIHGTTASGKQAHSTPLQIFTHVATHEFHHKGQILSMFRLLGHIPPDSDIIRT
jgi:uncharacterized damage-inducible protein DinB